MDLEQLIYKRLSESQELTGDLASFAGGPAVFSIRSPEADHEGWGGNTQYPQIVYNVDMQANEERKSVGTLVVTLICQNSMKILPEAVEPEVKKCLKDVLLRPESGSPYAFAWAGTDSFSIDGKENGALIGSKMRFDMFEYPDQETTDPDAVVAVNRYIKELDLNCLVIGLDRIDDITEISREIPVVYCRNVTMDKGTETNTVVWMDSGIAVHVLCPDMGIRIKAVAAIADQLSLAGEISMLDQSPVSIKQLQVNYRSDHLKDGQISAVLHYGLLKYRQKKHRIVEIVNTIN